MANERLQAMGKEQLAYQMKTDAIELALKAIMNKLEVPVPEESVMEEEFNFRQNSGSLVNSKMHALGYVKIKLATPADFNGDYENGSEPSSICVTYTLWSVVTSTWKLLHSILVYNVGGTPNEVDTIMV